jgi:hypothetical protein
MMKQNNYEYSSLIDNNCRTILSNHIDFMIAFLKRQANENAHALARATLSHTSRAIAEQDMYIRVRAFFSPLPLFRLKTHKGMSFNQ